MPSVEESHLGEREPVTGPLAQKGTWLSWSGGTGLQQAAGFLFPGEFKLRPRGHWAAWGPQDSTSTEVQLLCS